MKVSSSRTGFAAVFSTKTTKSRKILQKPSKFSAKRQENCDFIDFYPVFLQYCVYLQEKGDIDRVFAYFCRNHCITPAILQETERFSQKNSDLLQAFDEEMYAKYSCKKLNETQVIPLKTDVTLQNFSQSTAFSARIFSAKARQPTNSCDLATSLVISPTNQQHFTSVSQEMGVSQRKKRVFSAKIRPKRKKSCENSSLSLNLISKTYEPKQLTTDKCE